MLNSASSGVSVDSVRGKSRYSVDRGGSAELNAPISVAVERERTLKKGRSLKPGGREPPRIRAANLEGDTEDLAGLSTRRQAEMQPPERLWRYRMTLLRANRIAAIGQMSASIVHEINQPVTAVVSNAQATLRFLQGPIPDLDEVRQALTRIARLGNRVVEVVRHTRPIRILGEEEAFEPDGERGGIQ
jgi:C4-dicarboxylate-specific signal transduction histidine kinase